MNLIHERNNFILFIKSKFAIVRAVSKLICEERVTKYWRELAAPTPGVPVQRGRALLGGRGTSIKQKEQV